MTEKEKALELIEKFEYELIDTQKRYAIFIVDEIIKANVVWYDGSIPRKYWEKVKKEIKKL